MNLSNLSDNELIDYVIRHDPDAVRVRLATYMDRYPGKILEDLEDAGMDGTYCTFRSVINDHKYLPGEYVSQLEEEIKHLNNELFKANREIESLKPMKVSELILALKQEIDSAKYETKMAKMDAKEAIARERITQEKLDAWTILNS